MNCTRCSGTGFINAQCVPSDIEGWNNILAWIEVNQPTDASVCDCCGNSETWYGEPGQHYGSDDPRGANGPYAYNGGLCECH